jgi:ATP-dependent RNA helicase RhlE
LQGRDLLGIAQTGTGKTAAFALPILEHLAKKTDRAQRGTARALILAPTRELAAQIGDSFESYGRHLDLRHHVIFGGVGQNPQVRALKAGLDILVACPGRLLDLQGQGFVDLSQVDFFVLDEADRMLDMGFIHDVKRVLRLLPRRRQNLLFSATMPPAIVNLAGDFLHDPVHVEVTPNATTVERIDQKVMFVEQADKRRLLAEIIAQGDVEQAIVFTRTKHGANRLVKQLDEVGIQALAIHGNKSQGARTRALDAFREGTLSILVATDVASRGIDVDGVSHVFNFDLPNEPESYVHRIGRTGRAGRAGQAIAFCDETEGAYLRDIQKLIGEDIAIDDDHPWHTRVPDPRSPRPPNGGRGGGGGRPRGGGGRGGGGRGGGGRGGGGRGGYRGR